MTKMKEFKELAHSPTVSKRFIWNLNPGIWGETLSSTDSELPPLGNWALKAQGLGFAPCWTPRKLKSATVSPSICHEVMGLDAMILGPGGCPTNSTVEHWPRR